MNYMPDIIEYFDTMIGNQMFNPTNDYLNSCLICLINFTEIYKNYFLQRIKDYTLHRIFQLANNSGDENLIHLKDYFQSQIFAIKMQSL